MGFVLMEKYLKEILIIKYYILWVVSAVSQETASYISDFALAFNVLPGISQPWNKNLANCHTIKEIKNSVL